MNWSITSYHTETSNCATAGSWGSKTFDIICINQPQEGRRNRGGKAWMKKKEKELETIQNVFTPILKVKRFIFAFLLFTFSSFLSCSLLEQRGLSPITVLPAGTSLISVLSTKTQMWSYRKRAFGWIKEQSSPGCSSPEIWERSNIIYICIYV